MAAGKISGSSVNVRPTPATTGTPKAVVNTGDKVTYYPNESYSGSGYTWYRCTSTKWSGDGYIATQYVVPDTGGSYTVGNFVKLNTNNVNVRRTASSTQYGAIGYLRNGTKLICEGTDGSFVKVKWGGTTYATAYIHQDFVDDAGAAPASKKDKAIAIANSMADTGYAAASNFGLTATQWCVQWISFLMKASGCTSYPDFSTQAQVSTAIGFFGNKFGLRANKTPQVGDWVMYSKTGETYAHVGFIVAASGSNITTVEGNLSSTVKKVSSFNYNTGVNNFTVYGFATPSWT